MRIDTHIHIYDPAWGDYGWPPAGSVFYRVFSLAGYREVAPDAAPVVIGCSQEFELNDRIAAECDTAPGVAFVAQLDPRDKRCATYAQRLSAHPSYRGFRAVNEHILQSPERFIEAAGYGTVAEIQGNYHGTAKLIGLFAAHPEIFFVLEHFSGYLFDGGPTEPDYPPFLEKMASLPNVTMKLSGLYTLCRMNPKPVCAAPFAETFACVLRAFGADRCMYGSDWPVLDAPVVLAETVTEGIAESVFADDPEAVFRIMGGNARRIYSLRGGDGLQ